jgi:hypothetical protein
MELHAFPTADVLTRHYTHAPLPLLNPPGRSGPKRASSGEVTVESERKRWSGRRVGGWTWACGGESASRKAAEKEEKEEKRVSRVQRGTAPTADWGECSVVLSSPPTDE